MNLLTATTKIMNENTQISDMYSQTKGNGV